MIEDKASRTALRVAMRRAAHQILDHPKVLDDPIAIRILPDEAQRRVQTESPWQTPGERSLRAFMVTRSRYAEDRLAAAISRRATQYVLLGAGLDTYAYRSSSSTLRIFEVDHPATQEWKRERLRIGNIAIPANVEFVPVDFESQTLDEALGQAGFDMKAVSFFSWLGVTQYLTWEAAMATLRFIAGTGAGSGVVFDYSVPRETLAPVEQIAFDSMAERVARAGEPFRLFLEPAGLANVLRGMGFQEIEDLGHAEINQRFFENRQDGMRLFSSMARLMGATLGTGGAV